MADVAAHPTMSTAVAVNLRLPTARATAALGQRLAMVLRRGDLVLLTGELGAGKTTLAQGIGEGLGVRGPVTSPTFVIARVHPSLTGGPDLVHVDAYRLGTTTELDELDLDADLDHSVVVVEWGHGIAEALSGDRLEVMLEGRTRRTARVVGTGPRWNHPAAAGALRSLLAAPLA
jgi:tRNA threonylcarbamoyladenosine biosynthesis protein TsaE